MAQESSPNTPADSVGFWLDYEHFLVGLSPSRTEWLVNWMEGILKQGAVLVQSLYEGLGRLAFGVAAQGELRPFLGPLYAWCASVPRASYLPLPVLVQVVLRFLAGRLRVAGLRSEVGAGDTGDYQPTVTCFRADAKAEGEDVALGGWECAGGTEPGHARWFALRLNR